MPVRFRPRRRAHPRVRASGAARHARAATRLTAALLTALAVPGTTALSPAVASTPAAAPDTRAVSLAGDDPVGGARMGETGLVADVPAGVPAPPALPAGGYVLADATTGAVLVAKAPHAKGLPASTIKALTALALLPRMDPDRLVRARPEDAAVDGTKVGLDPGATYTVEQLFQSLLLASANDSAVALARTFGDPGAATAQMNETARRLGALDTTVRNTSGLDAPGQTSSAYDLALIGRAALRDATVAPYLDQRLVRFPGGRPTKRGERRAAYEIANHNKLIWNYPGTIGVKNGYTVRARQTYIGAARRGEKTYLVAFLNGATNDWRPTTALLDWAFAHGDRARPVGHLVEPGSLQAAPPAQPTQRALVAATVPGSAVVPPAPWLAAGAGAAAVALAGAVFLLRRSRR